MAGRTDIREVAWGRSHGYRGGDTTAGEPTLPPWEVILTATGGTLLQGKAHRYGGRSRATADIAWLRRRVT